MRSEYINSYKSFKIKVMNNKINVILTPENKETVVQAIKDAKTGMPFLIKLSKDERKSLQKMDDGRKPFVQKGVEFAKGNRDLDPVSYTHLRAHETRHDLVCRLLLEKKKK